MAYKVFTKNELGKLLVAWENLQSILKIYPANELVHVRADQGTEQLLFDGQYTDTLVNMLGREPELEELVMLVNNGLPTHGYLCRRSPTDNSFSGRVYLS